MIPVLFPRKNYLEDQRQRTVKTPATRAAAKDGMLMEELASAGRGKADA